MCREEALKLSQNILPLCDKIGINAYAVVKETLGQPEFTQFWKREIFLDESRGFYKVIGGGQEKKASLLSLFSKDVRENYSRAKKLAEGNMKGEGQILGGLMIISKQGIHYTYQEKTFGDHAPLQEIVDALQGFTTEKLSLDNGLVKPNGVVCQDDVCYKP